LLAKPQRLAELTIGDVVRYPGFGKKCLLDLLSALESYGTSQYSISPEVIRAAQRLLRRRDSRLVRRDDPRFGLAVQALGFCGENLCEIAQRIIDSLTCPMQPQLYAKRIGQMAIRLQTSKHFRLEEELADLLSSGRSERDRTLALRHLGWDGHGKQTLESLGNPLRMTRERVRQICELQVDRIYGKEPYLPILDQVLELSARAIPCVVQHLQERLVERGLTRGRFDLEGVIGAAEITGKMCPFVIEVVEGQLYTVSPRARNVPRVVVQLARKSVSHWGAATTEDIAAQVNNELSISIAPEFVAVILQGQPEFGWLDQMSGWFWFRSTARNVLMNHIAKVLCVCNRIHVSELRDGVSRHYRREGFAPPQRVLLALCRQADGYRVDGNMVIADPSLDYREVLAGTEKTMMEVLNENGRVMERQKFEDLCLARGIERGTFYIHLTYSPILVRYAPGVYALRGTDVPPGYAEALAAKRTKSHVLTEYGWKDDGNIFLSYVLSEPMVARGAVHVPSKLSAFLAGIYQIRVTQDQIFGQLTVKDTYAWGLSPLFRRRGGEPGDSLAILFDLQNRIATVELAQSSPDV
jgi:hypothetical protein